MFKKTKLAAFALLWLAVSGIAAYATPLEVNFNVVDHNYSILSGGRFGGSINGGPVFDIFCIDFQNSVTNISADPSAAYDAFISDSTDLSKTRYGTTSTFTYNPPSGTLTALDRYTLAAWLITQYTFPAGGPTADDNSIQTAIWTILSQNPAAPASDAGAATWITSALNFKSSNPGGFSALQSEFRIVTSADVAVATDRYHVGQQEYMYIVPEPGTFLLLGIGLVGFGLIRRRRA